MVKVLDNTQIEVSESTATVPETDVDSERRTLGSSQAVTADPLSILTDNDSSVSQRFTSDHQNEFRNGAVTPRNGQQSRDLTRELAEQEVGNQSSSDRDLEEERIRSLVRSAVRPAQRTLSPEALASLEQNVAQKLSGASANPAQLQAAMDELHNKMEGDLVANIRMGDRSEAEVVEELTATIFSFLEEEGLELESEPEIDGTTATQERVSPDEQAQLQRQAQIDAKVIAISQALESDAAVIAVAEVLRNTPEAMRQDVIDQYRETYQQSLRSAFNVAPGSAAETAVQQLLENGMLTDEQLYQVVEERALQYAERYARVTADRDSHLRQIEEVKAEWERELAQYSNLLSRTPGLEQQLERTINYHSDQIRADIIARTVYDMSEFARKQWGREKENTQAHNYALEQLERYKDKNRDFFERNPELERQILEHEQAAEDRVDRLFRFASGRASALMNEFRGWTSSEDIYDLLNGLSYEEVVHVRGYFNAMGRGDLDAWVKSDVSNGTFSYTGYEDACLDILHGHRNSRNATAPILNFDEHFEGKDPRENTANLFSEAAIDQLFAQTQLALEGEMPAFDLHALLSQLTPEQRAELEERILTETGSTLEELIEQKVSDDKLTVTNPETGEEQSSTSEQELALMLISGEEIDNDKFFSYINFVHSDYATDRAALLASEHNADNEASIEAEDQRFRRLNERLVSQFGVTPDAIAQIEANVKRLEEQRRFELVRQEVSEQSQEVGIQRAQGVDNEASVQRAQAERDQYLESQAGFVEQASDQEIAAVQSGSLAMEQLPPEKQRYILLLQDMDRSERQGQSLYLSAESSIKEIEAAMYGGLERIGIPFGTDEDRIYAMLEGKSERELSIMQVLYKQRFGRSMRGDFLDEMGGAHLDRAVALMEQRKADAVAAESYLALTAFWGPDKEKLRTAVDKLDTEEERAQFNETFNEEYLENLESRAEQRDSVHSEYESSTPNYEFSNFEDVVVNYMGEHDAAIVMADLEDDDTALAVALIAENLTRFNISEHELATTVEAEVIDPKTGEIDPEKLKAFRERFEELQGKSFDEAIDDIYGAYEGDQYTGITWLQMMTEVDEEGKPAHTREEIAAAKIWWAVKGMGADTDTVKAAVVPPDILEIPEDKAQEFAAMQDPAARAEAIEQFRIEKQQEYIAGVDAAFQELSGGEDLRSCVRDQFWESNERTIIHLIDNGKLDEIYEMREAMGTYMDSCDVEVVKRILQGKTKEEIEDFIERFNEEFDIDFLTRLKTELNGSDGVRRATNGGLWSLANPIAGTAAFFSEVEDSQDWFDVQVLLEGNYSDVQAGSEEAVEALQAFQRHIEERRDYDRSGWEWGQNLATMGLGKELDEESREAIQYIEAALADGFVSDEELRQARALRDRTQSISGSFRQQRDAMAQQVADAGTMVVLTGTCIVVTVATAGTGAPVAVLVWTGVAGATASGAIRYGTKSVLCGSSYTTDMSAVGTDGVLAFVDGLTMGIGVGVGGKITGDIAKRVGTRAMQNGVKVYFRGRLLTEADEIGHVLIQRSLLARAGTNSITGAIDGGSSAFAVTGVTTAMDGQTWENGVWSGLNQVFSNSLASVPQGVGLGVGLGSLFSIRKPKVMRMSTQLTDAQVDTMVSRGQLSQSDVQTIVERDGYVTRGAALEIGYQSSTVPQRRANRWINKAERNGTITPEQAVDLRTQVTEGTISELDLRNAVNRNPYDYYVFQIDPNAATNRDALDTTFTVSQRAAGGQSSRSQAGDESVDGSQGRETRQGDTSESRTQTTVDAAEAPTQQVSDNLPTQDEILRNLTGDAEVNIDPIGVPESPAPESFQARQARNRGPQYEQQMESRGDAQVSSQPETRADVDAAESNTVYADDVAPATQSDLDAVLNETELRNQQSGDGDSSFLDDVIAETEHRIQNGTHESSRTNELVSTSPDSDAQASFLDDVIAETELQMQQSGDAQVVDVENNSQIMNSRVDTDAEFDFGLPQEIMIAPEDVVQRFQADPDIPGDAKIDIYQIQSRNGEVRFDEIQDVLTRNNVSDEVAARYQVSDEHLAQAREQGYRYETSSEVSQRTSETNEGTSTQSGSSDGNGSGSGSGSENGSGSRPQQTHEGVEEISAHQRELEDALYGPDSNSRSNPTNPADDVSQSSQQADHTGAQSQREMQANSNVTDDVQALVDNNGEWPLLEDVHTLLRNRQGDAAISDSEVSITNRDVETALAEAGYTRSQAREMLAEFEAANPNHPSLRALRQVVDCAEGNFSSSRSGVASDVELENKLLEINEKYSEVIETARKYREYLAEEGQFEEVTVIDDLIDLNLGSQANETRGLKVDQCDPSDLARQLDTHLQELETLRRVMDDQMQGGSWESNGGTPRRNPGGGGDGDSNVATMTDIDVETSSVRNMFEQVAPSITGRVDVEPRRAPSNAPSTDGSSSSVESQATTNRPAVSDEIEARQSAPDADQRLADDIEMEMRNSADADLDEMFLPVYGRGNSPHYNPTYVRVPLTQGKASAVRQRVAVTTFRDTPVPPKRAARSHHGGDGVPNESLVRRFDPSFKPSELVVRRELEYRMIDQFERRDPEYARKALRRRTDEEFEELSAFGLAGRYTERGWEETG